MTGEYYTPVRTTVVVTLRDLRDEHPREVRRWPLYPEDRRSNEARNLAWTVDLLGLTLLAVEWRGGEDDPVLNNDLRQFLLDVARWIGGGKDAYPPPIVGADLVLSVSREPLT